MTWPERQQGRSQSAEFESQLLDIRGIRPVTLAVPARVMTAEYSDMINHRDDYIRSFASNNRGIKELYELSSSDYARLPGFHEQSAYETARLLLPGSLVLDVGCGTGANLYEVKHGHVVPEVIQQRYPNQKSYPAVNSEIVPYGFDAMEIPGQQVHLEQGHFAQGNIDELFRIVQTQFGEGIRFPLITASAVIYHLPDPWYALLQMGKLLEPNGKLLASTMPLIIAGFYDNDYSVQDSAGRIMSPFDKRPEQLLNFWDRGTVFDTSGKVVSLPDLVRYFNDISKNNFELEFAEIEREERRLSAGDDFYGFESDLLADPQLNVVLGRGGRIAGMRLSEKALNLSRLFYCEHHSLNPKFRTSAGHTLGYIVADSEKEAVTLREQGYFSVQDRFEKTYSNI